MSLVRIQSPRPVSSKAVLLHRYNGRASQPRWTNSDDSVTKILLLIAAAVAVYLVMAGAARRRRGTAEQPVESMVVCAHCSINLPQSEAQAEAGRFFCSEEHRRLGPK